MFDVDRTICMVLDKRLDMYVKLSDEFHSRGLEIEPFVMGHPGTVEDLDDYSYIDGNELPTRYFGGTNYATWYKYPNAYNMWKAQRIVLQNVCDEGVNHLWLLEDDAGFRQNFDEIAPKVDKWLENHHVDMLYLGGFGDLTNFPTVYCCKEFNLSVLDGMYPYGGFHSVILSKLAIVNLLNFPALGPYDEISHRFLHSRYTTDSNLFCLAVNPTIMCQKSGFSYIENHNIDRTNQQ